jgi:hypothetical protein
MFPNDAILNFNNAILEAELTFWHKGNAAAGSANNYVQSVYQPRYGLASLIQEFNIYILMVKQYQRHLPIITFIIGYKIGFKIKMLKL